ncbi:hypothetical protein HDR58_08305 [bacterium]|nr:hypothetical protein [bacterium]
MSKNLAIIKSENVEIIEAIEQYFANKDVKIVYFDTLEEMNLSNIQIDLVTQCSFVKTSNYSYFDNKKVPMLNLHPSLLPSFAQEGALEVSFVSGIKVGGITIHKVEPNMFYSTILAQYPVLIGLTTHLEEYKQELIAVSRKLYPLVIDAILSDKVFDFADLFKNSCSGHCGGCSGNHCSH